MLDSHGTSLQVVIKACACSCETEHHAMKACRGHVIKAQYILNSASDEKRAHSTH